MRGSQAHHIEKRSVDDAGLHHSRFGAERDQREIDRGEIAEGGDGGRALLEVGDLRHRERVVFDADARRGLTDVDQPLLAAIDERPQEHAPDDAEDGGVRSDAEAERHDDGCGQALGAQERPDRNAHVTGEFDQRIAHRLNQHIGPHRQTACRDRKSRLRQLFSKLARTQRPPPADASRVGRCRSISGKRSNQHAPSCVFKDFLARISFGRMRLAAIVLAASFAPAVVAQLPDRPGDRSSPQRQRNFARPAVAPDGPRPVPGNPAEPWQRAHPGRIRPPRALRKPAGDTGSAVRTPRLRLPLPISPGRRSFGRSRRERR